MSDPDLMGLLAEQARRRQAEGTTEDPLHQLERIAADEADEAEEQALRDRGPEWAAAVDAARPISESQKDGTIEAILGTFAEARSQAASERDEGKKMRSLFGHVGLGPGRAVAASLVAAAALIALWVWAPREPEPLPKYAVHVGTGPGSKPQTVLHWPTDESGVPLQAPRAPFSVVVTPETAYDGRVQLKAWKIDGESEPIDTRVEVSPHGALRIHFLDPRQLIGTSSIRFEIRPESAPDATKGPAECAAPECRVVDLPVKLEARRMR